MITSPPEDLARQPTTGVVVVDEVDRYGGAIAGIAVESVRISKGHGPTVVLSYDDGSVAMNSVSAGFGAVGRSAVPEHLAVATVFHEAPAGTRWCGIDITPGTLVTYGPGAEHIGSNPEGVRFSFAVAPLAWLDSMSACYDRPLLPPKAGSVTVHAPTRRTYDLGVLLNRQWSDVQRGAALDDETLAAIERAFVVTMSDGDNEILSSSLDRRRSDRGIVSSCLAYADAIGRVPTMNEIHSAVFVSERRLRYAFTRILEEPPSVALRQWAMDRARRELLAADPGEDSVTRIATRIGFPHHGRFAARYRAVFGEYPSETLATVA